ncbi:alpha/beta fold hydrolase [Companilactobacillus alimentarius]|uniref:alpha/beta hydrolase n=1 Tax=Companilactobacillus alimentarius TaxID=1602 RepID=UPI0028B481A2|nr:alpha/beta hydrolase family protein [Companilactobacillus alimentarius]MDT6951676.1 alpha/beta hydrolase family protein [Companilactobacillus alimentarius]
MVLMNLSYRTNYLHTYFKTTVVIPDTNKSDYPVVWLLHGYTGDNTAWSKHVYIEELARKYDWTIIMPDGLNSFYSDSKFIPYESFFMEEFIPKMQNLLPISRDPQKNYLVGSSMGGYGALKFAFKNTDKFGKVAALSPITDIEHFRDNPQCPMSQEVFNAIFDSPEKIAKNQLINLYNNRQPKLPILTLCGDSDFMHEDNVMFKNFLSIHAKGHYTWMPVSGNHSWKVWSENIDPVFNWLTKN